MLSTDNKEVSIDPARFSWQPHPYFNPSNYSPSPSTSPSDLLQFHCINSPNSLKEFSLQHRFYSDPGIDVSHYSSPPPSITNPKRTLSLPSLSTDVGRLTGARQEPFGGILDSPVVGHHVLTRDLTPISPPTTVPSRTLSLPATDEDFASDDIDGPDFASDDHQALLSPLSPEWETSSIEDLSSTNRTDGIVLLSSHGSNRDFYRSTHEDPQRGLWGAPSPIESGGTDTNKSIGPRFRMPPLAYDEGDSISFLPPFPHPSSPSISISNLDLNEPPDSPLWSPSSLPELEMDDGDSDCDSLLTPPSPSSRTLSLSGDDDFFDGHMTWSGSEPDFLQIPEETSGSFSGRSQGLLLIDDANDVPTPRSPSPDNFDLDPSLYASCSDPDVAKLVALRRKSQIAERQAKEVEESSLSQGSMFVRAEARKKRKKEKERVKEINAMLKLKMEESLPATEEAGNLSPGGGYENRRCRCPSPEVKRVKAKKGISSIPQLVARMIFRRRDGSDRPITHIPMPSKPKPSPLRKSWGVDDEDSDEDDSDDYMGLDDSLMELKGFDDLSSPMSSPSNSSTSTLCSATSDEESFGKL